MTEIVKRLRERAAQKASLTNDPNTLDVLLESRAADEIERLKEKIEDMHRARSADFRRRVGVEQHLLDAASGKVRLPDEAACRELASRLGVPDGYRLDPIRLAEFDRATGYCAECGCHGTHDSECIFREGERA